VSSVHSSDRWKRGVVVDDFSLDWCRCCVFLSVFWHYCWLIEGQIVRNSQAVRWKNVFKISVILTKFWDPVPINLYWSVPDMACKSRQSTVLWQILPLSVYAVQKAKILQFWLNYQLLGLLFWPRYPCRPNLACSNRFVHSYKPYFIWIVLFFFALCRQCSNFRRFWTLSSENWNFPFLLCATALYAIAHICYGNSVRPSVCLSVTRVDQSKTVEAVQ